MKIIVKIADGGREIGFIETDDGCFYKTVQASKHKLRTPPSWAIDANAFDNQIAQKAKFIVITDTDSMKKYVCTVALFNDKKGKISRGHGVQYFLTDKYWTIKA